ncbi:MAG: MoxR family ATPase [Pseudomonadota bacterium]
MTDAVALKPALQAEARDALQRSVATLNQIILGKADKIDLALTCLLAGGHFLIEDVPGVGKTTLARALAAVLGLEFARVQFTSDLLPADVTGVSVYQQGDGSFRFHPGPVFTQMLLADEINRATPKAQSALLEAMQERQVTVDGEAHRLPSPFFVVATQNPVDQIGTFALPESQLDRFLMSTSLGYPDAESERQLLSGHRPAATLDSQPAVLRPDAIRVLQDAVTRVKVADALLDYLQSLIDYTRNSNMFITGLSPRAAIALTNAARAHALLKGRDAVYPEDLQAVFVAVSGHRLQSTGALESASATDRAQHVLDSVAIP